MKKMLSFILLFFISISYVNADEFNLAFEGEDSVNKTVVVDLVINDITETDSLFYGVTGTLEYDDENLELISIKGKNNFNLTYNEKNKKLILYHLRGVNEKTVILSMEFKNKNNLSEGNTSISLKNAKVSDLKKDIEIYDISKTINYEGNSDNTNSNTYLLEIVINGKKLNIEKDKINYNILVSNDTNKITVGAILEDENGKVSGTGDYDLVVGNNEIELVVTNGDDKRVYTVNIGRETADSDNQSDELFIKSEIKEETTIWNYIGPGIFVAAIYLCFVLFKKKRKNV